MQNTFFFKNELTKTQGINDNGTSGAHSYLLRTKKRQSETASVMCGHGSLNVKNACSRSRDLYIRSYSCTRYPCPRETRVTSTGRRGGLQAGTFHWAGAIEASISLCHSPDHLICCILLHMLTSAVHLELGCMAPSAVHLELSCMAPPRT